MMTWQLLFVVSIGFAVLIAVLLMPAILAWIGKKGFRELPHATDRNGLWGIIIVQGRWRTYYLHLPQQGRGRKIPLLLALHGGHGNAERFARMTNFNAIADREQFAVVYPNARTWWNDGRSTTASRPDDLAFIEALLDHLLQAWNIDADRIYVAGNSSGGMFTFRLACEMADRIAAFAAVSASMPVLLQERCRPSRPAPLLMINMTLDPFVPWHGGKVRSGNRWGAGGELISVPETLNFWRRHNHCWSALRTQPLTVENSRQPAAVTLIDYPCRSGGAALKLIRVESHGHGWPGADTSRIYGLARLVSRTSGKKTIDASELVWAFLRDYRLPAKMH